MALPAADQVKKTYQKGTETNDKGEFSIDVKPGDVLIISYVGFQTKAINKVVTDILNAVLLTSKSL